MWPQEEAFGANQADRSTPPKNLIPSMLVPREQDARKGRIKEGQSFFRGLRLALVPRSSTSISIHSSIRVRLRVQIARVPMDRIVSLTIQVFKETPYYIYLSGSARAK